MQSTVLVRRTGTSAYVRIDAVVPLPVPVAYNAALLYSCTIVDCYWNDVTKALRILNGAANYRQDIVRRSGGPLGADLDTRMCIGIGNRDITGLQTGWGARSVPLVSETPIVKGYVIVSTELGLVSATYLVESAIRVSYEPVKIADSDVMRLQLDEVSDNWLGR